MPTRFCRVSITASMGLYGIGVPSMTSASSDTLINDLPSSFDSSEPPTTAEAPLRRIVLPTPWTTRVLVGINAAVFLAMVLTGVSPTQSNNAQLLRWGANWGPLALDGQPWRMLTSNYVHIGIIHIALNMWCLWDLGRLSELIFGRWTLLLVYTACGLAGSMASLWFHPW